ncbi:hypothetical protein [Motiliproteus sp.]|uniref:hypothetical protein n=1 Tax=Motiliproteus sp. TaxID=1898955 RepID=UPI003BABB259
MTKSIWNSQPASGEWNLSENWTPSKVPPVNAEFGPSSQTSIGFSNTSDATVETIEFSENASAYTFLFGPSDTPALTISGQGVSNSSYNRQSFVVAATSHGFSNPQLKFTNEATAGSDNLFYCAGPVTEQGYGGGVICFCDQANAGSASFKVWTGAATPPKHSTVGGEVSFCNSSSAANARFTIYGSLGLDGDTFGNVVFHDTATAANANFINVGGTVSGGDGGNTQFYGNSTAAYGIYNNWGGTHPKANGGDVAFDATADGGQGQFHNYAAKAAGAYGGVTSFNNNPPHMNTQGASAGNGAYYNYGTREGEQGGGGHVEFSAKYGSPTAANARIINYGSTIKSKSTAGHTIFSINLPTDYYPTAGNACIWNHPGETQQGAAGYTEFSVYGSGNGGDQVPTAGNATIYNLGAYLPQAAGGYTLFSDTASAGNATLIAYGGSHGGHGGRIVFYGSASGDTAKVQLYDNAELDLRDHATGLTLDRLDLTGGVIAIRLGTETAGLTVSGQLSLHSKPVYFYFSQPKDEDFANNKAYTILSNSGLSGFSAEQFAGSSIDGVEPTFSIVGNDLQVSFNKP